eukprot:TRINITY_DN18448_c0_g1_i2.p2 TRINITY_DN18448_c0_g1~~TRINITY_DN18448_c0_g1_i2.p2  ORF type:complete len:116 (+),score=5.83 TRINITY_DN18448_c0_g1_i2:229-576(+)
MSDRRAMMISRPWRCVCGWTGTVKHRSNHIKNHVKHKVHMDAHPEDAEKLERLCAKMTYGEADAYVRCRTNELNRCTDVTVIDDQIDTEQSTYYQAYGYDSYVSDSEINFNVGFR